MLVSCRVPRHHGIDALTGLMQTHIFYLIFKALGMREDYQRRNNNRKTNPLKTIRRCYFPQPHVYNNTLKNNCQQKYQKFLKIGLKSHKI